MSPYCPSAHKLKHVIEKLVTKYKCELKDGPALMGPRGTIIPQYLKRVDADGTIRIAPLPADEPDVDALPSVIRSICAQLDLPLHNTDFGVLSSLADLDDEPDDDIDSNAVS